MLGGKFIKLTVLLFVLRDCLDAKFCKTFDTETNVSTWFPSLVFASHLYGFFA